MVSKAISKAWKSAYNQVRPLWKKTLFPVGHFYSPIPDRSEAKIAFDRAMAKRDEIPAAITIDDEAMLALWRDLVPFMNEAPFSDVAGQGQRYQYDNPYYSYGDALVLHALLRLHKPAVYLEIGAGYSTAAALDTQQVRGYPQSVICVEPYPGRLKSLMRDGDAKTVEIIEKKAQNTDLRLYRKLSKGDFLFIDSSHVMKTGSDLNFIIHEILPSLSSGVIVHFHDVFWPFEYPEKWLVEDNRAWNELYALRSFLMYNNAFRILFFNDYFKYQHRNAAERDCPRFMRSAGGGLWLERCPG